MFKLSLALVAALVTTARGVDVSEPRLAKRTTGPTYALKTTDAYLAGSTPTWKTSFSVYSTYDLYLSTEITGNLPGHHTAAVDVIMPSGSAYQRLSVTFATDVPAAPGELQAERTPTGWRVVVSLPVAGTMIQQSNLVGAWSAQVWIDSASRANARASFRMY